MPRVRLEPLEKYPFSVVIEVRTTDVNYRGHLGNDRLLTLVHEARVAFLKKHGFTEKDCGGVALIMADTAVLYQGEAFAGDFLRFEAAAGEPTRCGLRFFYRVTNQATGRAIALVENGMVCYDYENKQPVPLPAAKLLKKFDQNF